MIGFLKSHRHNIGCHHSEPNILNAVTSISGMSKLRLIDFSPNIFIDTGYDNFNVCTLKTTIPL